MYDLKNKKALITGGSSGLGLEIAKILKGRGAKVTIAARNLDKLEKAAKEIGNDIEYFEMDVSNLSEVKRNSEQFDKIDILVNSAGIIQYDKLENHELEDINKIININLAGAIYCTRMAINGMKERGDGSIVNISSTSGLYGRANETVYVASKWGLRGFSEGLKTELKGSGVEVFGVYPGGMNTSLFENSPTPKDTSTFMDPAKVAEVIVRNIENKDEMLVNSIEINRLTK